MPTDFKHGGIVPTNCPQPFRVTQWHGIPWAVNHTLEEDGVFRFYVDAHQVSTAQLPVGHDFNFIPYIAHILCLDTRCLLFTLISTCINQS